MWHSSIGDSGDTITIPAGATVEQEHKLVLVEMELSIGKHLLRLRILQQHRRVFCDTSSGAFTLTLPSSPSVGDIVAAKDYSNTFDTNV